MAHSPTQLDTLIQLLSKLPGLGPRSARRAALFLIKRRESLMEPLSLALADAARAVTPCSVCGNLDTIDPCALCSDPGRDAALICVVEDVADLWAIERAHIFKGRYHVLGGLISPMDGIGPAQLRVKELVERIGRESPREIILATNPNAEGEATALYLSRLLQPLGVMVTRLAYGLPIGGDLDYADEITLAKALEGRTTL